MRLAKIVTALGALAMMAALAYAFTQGDIAVKGAQLLSMPWGAVSLATCRSASSCFRAGSCTKRHPSCAPECGSR